MMMLRKGHSFGRRAGGFSLIEVLVAAVVLATGLLALAALQAALARNSADARARSQVASFADLVMERQRAAGAGTGYNDIPFNNAWTAAELTAIQTSAGVSNLAVGVASTHYDGRTGAFVVYNPAGTPIAMDDPQYKEVVVAATWTDATGAARRFEMPAILSPRSISDSNTLFDLPTNSGSTGSPVVRTDTPTETGIIPIAIGDNTDTAATNPRPEVAGRNNDSSVVGTSYEVLTYRNENSTTVRTQRRVETKVIDCTCSPGTAPTGDFFATAQWPAYWDGERYSVFKPDNNAAAPGSTRTVSAASGVVQDELCTDCCRDHHDNVAVEDDSPGSCTSYEECAENLVEFDPFRTDAHVHYKLEGGVLVLAGDGDDYRESCRMIRVDGFWRTATDLNLDHLGLIATVNSGRSAAPTTIATENYEDFVIGYLDSNYVEGGAQASAESIFATEGLNDPALISIGRPPPTDTRYLHARGLYVDYLERKARKKLADEADDCTAADPVECVLPFLPFTTINTTELAFWDSSAPDTLSVTSGSSLVFNPDMPTRGRVDAISGAPSGQPSGAIRPNLTKSNAGVAIASAVDAEDSVTVTDSQQFQLAAGGSEDGESFTVVVSGLPQIGDDNTSNDPALGWAVGAAFGNCIGSFSNNQDKNPNPYGCNTTSPLNVAASVRVESYNRQSDEAENVAVTCSGLSGTWNEARYCENYQVASATIGAAAGSPNAAQNDGGTTSEYTVIDFSVVAPLDQVDIGFTLQSRTQVTTVASCTLNGGGNKITSVTWAACP